MSGKTVVTESGLIGEGRIAKMDTAGKSRKNALNQFAILEQGMACIEVQKTGVPTGEWILSSSSILTQSLASADRERGIRFIRAAGGDAWLSYGALHRKASRILAALQERGLARGDKLVVQLQDLEAFVPVFWACLLGGLVPVPVQVGPRQEHRRKLLNIWQIVGCPPVLTDRREKALSQFYDDDHANSLLGELDSKTLYFNEIPDNGPEAESEAIGPDDVALIQFSSGSTGDPTGVVLTHANLDFHLAAFSGALGISPSDSFLSWFPLTHDMGLIGWHLMPAFCGVDQTLMPTDSFIRRPARWLSTAATLRASVLCSPNFGLRHFLKLFRPESAEGWDLSAVRLLVNGAEQISAGLCREFSTALEPFGLRRSAMTPGYGLAEATLAVSCAVAAADEDFMVHRVDRRSLEIGQQVREVEDPRHALDLVDLGRPIPGTEVRIVDSEARALQPNRVGIVEVRGPSVGHYYQQSAPPGNADGWLNTGDLGFLKADRLVITGRTKDLIVLHGFNYFPHDIERVCQELESVELGKIVARGVRRPGSEEEQLALFVYFKKPLSEFLTLSDLLRDQVLQQVGLVVAHVIPIRTIPKTTSGKIRGFELAQRFEQGEFDEVIEMLERERRSAGASLSLEALPQARRKPRLLKLLREEAFRLLNAEPELERSLFEQGMDSIRAVEFSRRICSQLGLNLPETLIFEHSSILAIADSIVDGIAADSTAAKVQVPGQEPGGDYVASDSIAIVGLGCRFPGGIQDTDDYWRLLADGVSAIGEVPPDRWSVDGEPDGALLPEQRSSLRFGAFLDQVDGFDQRFFRISPREAESLDPQARLLLEVCWEALENSGYDVPALAEQECGVFVGISNVDYSRAHFHSGDSSKIDTTSYTGTAMSMTAGRISHVLGLRGPALAIDTACSSSLVAVHLAVQALRNRDCDLALVCGVNLMLSPEGHLSLAMMGALASDGRCRAFDDRANGYVRGEGCGVVVLKRCSDATQSGDRIRAVIRGSAINHDGASSGLTVPSGEAQQRVIRRALDRAGLRPDEIDFVETHGTGTPLGDPIEIGALNAVFGSGRKRKLLAGAVKSNLGHLESAAGIAGLIKLVLSLEQETIPRNLNFSKPSGRIPWDRIGVGVPIAMEPWKRADRPRIGGVSSFGFSGTNAHVVVAEAPVVENGTGQRDATAAPIAVPDPGLYPLSARSGNALREYARRHAGFLRQRPAGELYDSLWTASVRRSHLEFRATCRFHSSDQLLQQLDALAAGASIDGLDIGRQPVTGGKRLAFVFSGQGGQWSGMGQGLLESEPVFRAALERCDGLLQKFSSWSLLDELRCDPEKSRLPDTAVAQPVIFALQVGLVELLKHYGLRPDGLVGHSCGEVTAAWAAGRLSLEDAVEVIYRRGQLMQPTAGKGRMAAVGLSPDQLAPYLEPFAGHVSIAAINAPDMTIVAGEPSAIEDVLGMLADHQVRHKRLEFDYAFHSQQMAEPAAALARQLLSLRPLAGELPIYSTVSGGLNDREPFDARHWASNVRKPVLFASAIDEMIADGFTHFVEIGPHPHLALPILQCLEESRSVSGSDSESGVVVPTLHRQGHCHVEVIRALAELYCGGLNLDWQRIYASRGRQVDLPAYPWQRQRAWRDDWIPGNGARHPVAEAIVNATPTPPELLYRCEWEQAVAGAPAPVGATGPWVVLVPEAGTVATAVCRQLRDAGVELYEAIAPGPDQPAGHQDGAGSTLENVLTELSVAGKTPRGILYLGLSDADAGEPGLQRLMSAQESGVLGVVHLVRALAGLASGQAPKELWLVTNGTQQPQADDKAANLPYASIWGLGRVVETEHPELGCRRIDLSLRPSANEVGRLAALLGAAALPEAEIAVRGDSRTFYCRLRHPVDHRQQRPPLSIDPECSYLITGGYGAVGIELARSLVERGARYLALVGRSGPGDRAREQIEAMIKRGATIEVVQADVSQPADVAAALERIDAVMPPLKGLIHAAGVLNDATLHRIDRDGYLEVVAPKVAGSWNLHAATAGRSLDFFICLSSAATLLGSPGQGSYVAGNYFLDALADYRQALGLPSLSLSLGSLAGAGMSAPSAVSRWTGDAGLEAMTIEECVDALPGLWQMGFSRLGLMRFDIARWLKRHPVGAKFGYLSRLREAVQVDAPEDNSLIERLSALPSEQEVSRAVEAELLSMLAAALKMQPDEIGPDEPLRDLGFDSMMAVRLRVQLEQRFAVLVPITSFWTYQTAEKFSRYLCQVAGLTDRFRAIAAQVPDPGAQESNDISLDRLRAELDNRIKRYL